MAKILKQLNTVTKRIWFLGFPLGLIISLLAYISCPPASRYFFYEMPWQWISFFNSFWLFPFFFWTGIVLAIAALFFSFAYEDTLGALFKWIKNGSK